MANAFFRRFRLLSLCLALFAGLAFPALSGEDDRAAVHDAATTAPAVDWNGELRRILAGDGADGENRLAAFRDWRARAEAAGTDAAALLTEAEKTADENEAATLRDLVALADIVNAVHDKAWAALGSPEYGKNEPAATLELFMAAEPANRDLAVEALTLIANSFRDGERLLGLRDQLLEKLQDEMRRDQAHAGTRLAWAILRSGMAGVGTRIDPESVTYDENRASASLTVMGVPMRVEMDAADLEKRIRAVVDGHNFTSGWTVLFQKPFGWMAYLAQAMRQAGVAADPAVTWRVMEGPGGPIAIAYETSPDNGGEGKALRAFFDGALRPVTNSPIPPDASRLTEEFVSAARALHQGVMGDETIPQPLRQALHPVLLGTYQKPDPRDYFDSAFCRRLIESDYLEANIGALSPERAKELAAYREALGKIETGRDAFILELGGDVRAAAMVRPEIAFGGAEDQRDPETGETAARYWWRVEKPDETVFFSPLPARQIYAFSLADHYPGNHKNIPAGVPARTEVWHPILGRIASYDQGADSAMGKREDWDAAASMDTAGRPAPSPAGPPGWGFPLHVLQRNDQGDPTLLAVPEGVVPSPDFSGVADPEKRRLAEEEWLNHAAKVLATPGELNLIFHQFFRYCSDSPLPERPNLIGSHFGLSDTHQTVAQSLARRWAGRLIGDCDDLAEFFQDLTRRQGKLSHVMQLPAHAAAGYAEANGDGGYDFAVLQTGPALLFTAPTFEAAVEKAYRYFDDDGGMSRLTAAAVPLLLRFADEDTRTPFVLPARIYRDRDYAETMIRVQGYWHKYVFSAAIREMEEMLKTDREIGNVKELASLYERVGKYDEAAALRREELERTGDDVQASLSALLELAQLRVQERDKPAALEALEKMRGIMQRQRDDGDGTGFADAMSFRAAWAYLLTRLGEPERAWDLLRLDVRAAKARGGRLPESLLRVLTAMYERMGDKPSGVDDGADAPATDEVRKAVGREIARGLRSGFFKADDSYNTIISRYSVLGRYAVAEIGREKGLEALLQDGPYPTSPKEHIERDADVTETDWEWFRIVPRLYLTLGLDMLDREERPDLFNPEGAKPLLEGVARAVAKGRGLGADVAGSEDVVKSALILSFLNRDLEAFNRVMAGVRERNFSSLYDDAAVVFGVHCGLLPLADFPEWVEAFHRFFPARQNYFKAAYLALDKGSLEHALLLAEATARFFPDDRLLTEEAAYMRMRVPELKKAREEREKTSDEESG